MHHPWKFATVVTVALALTACADSARNPITEPNGLSLAKGTVTPLSPPLQALHDAIAAKTTALYFCGTSRLAANTAKDVEKLLTYAEFGWWTAEDGAEDGAAAHENVAYIAAKMIANNESNLAAGKVCNDQALVDELAFLINLFANQGEFSDGDIVATSCPSATDCEETGNGWKFDIPAGSFGTDVIVVVKPNNGSPPSGFTPASNSNSFHFDVFPPGDANSPWTRYICWEGDNPGVDDNSPPSEWVVMVREAGGGELDYLPPADVVEWDGATCISSTTSSNLFLKGAHKLLAGLPFFPKDLHAYSPPRTFGGTSTAASPHWLTVVEPVDPPPEFTLQDLYALTEEYYGDANPNKTAALGKLQDAIDCTENTELTEAQITECVNTALQQYINNVRAQTGKQGVTVEEGEELMGLALSLMQ